MTGFSFTLTYDVTCIGAQREERTLQPGTVPPSQPSDVLQRPPSASLVGGAPWTPTRADRVRDFLAAVALLASLGLDWDADTLALFRVDVAIVTGLSLLSLLLPAASRRGMFGQTWTPAKLRALKLICVAPYLAVVMVCLGWDISCRWTEWDYGGTGFGPAVWIGLAGAVLAGQPREADLFDVSGHDGFGVAGRQSRALLLVVGGLFAAMTVSAVVIDVVRFVENLDAVAGLRVSVLDPLVSAAAAVAWLIVVGRLILSAATGKTGSSLSLSLLGWAAAGWALMVSLPGVPYESVDSVTTGYLGIAVLGGIGAAALSPALPRRIAMTQHEYYSAPLGVVMAVSLLWVALSVAGLTLYSATSAVLAALVFFTLALAGATLVRDRMSSGPGDQQKALFGFAIGLVITAIAVLVVMSVRVNWNLPAPLALWLVGFVVPAFIVWREALAPSLARGGIR